MIVLMLKPELYLFLGALRSFKRFTTRVTYLFYHLRYEMYTLEDASVIDCQQPGMVPNAVYWIIAWFVLSITSIVSSGVFFADRIR